MKFKIEMKSWDDPDAWRKGNSGIYLLIFPNGMKYIGKSKCIPLRIDQHLNDFRYRKTDWHAAALKTFLLTEKKGKLTWKEVFYSFLREVKVYVQTCEEGLETAYEKQALREIDKNGFREQYYNTQYPKPIKEVDFTGLI